jgi:hypothetical protein
MKMVEEIKWSKYFSKDKEKLLQGYIILSEDLFQKLLKRRLKLLARELYVDIDHGFDDLPYSAEAFVYEFRMQVNKEFAYSEFFLRVKDRLYQPMELCEIFELIKLIQCESSIISTYRWERWEAEEAAEAGRMDEAIEMEENALKMVAY